jgi:hypothetical protein
VLSTKLLLGVIQDLVHYLVGGRVFRVGDIELEVLVVSKMSPVFLCI